MNNDNDLTPTGRTPSEPEVQELPAKTTTDAAACLTQQDGPQQFCYSLVLAEVIFSTDKGVGSQRTQLFSKADVPNFPAARLGQLQNSVAHQVQGQVSDKNFKALEVVILNILPLGWMTDEGFWGSKAAIPTGAEGLPAAAPQAPSNNVDNVVPLLRP